MFSLLLAALLSIVASERGADHDYTLAYHRSVEESKPLMVVVGADWCPACTALKNDTIPTLEQNGDLTDVSVAVVDRDSEPELARQLMKGEGRIPQIIMFTKSDTGRWQSRKLTGFQSAQPIRSMIRRALEGSRG